MKRTARCHCGSLVVYVSCEPEWVNVCHCIACQRRTGTVLHAGAYFPLAQVRIEGISTSYGRPADSGYEMSFCFCPVCGTNLYWHATRFPEHLGVAVGAFADPTFPARLFRCGRSPCIRGSACHQACNGSQGAVSAARSTRQIHPTDHGHDRL
jgi:hypothetical protein